MTEPINLPELTPWQLIAIRAAVAEDMRRKPRQRIVDRILYALRKRPDAYRCHPTDLHKWIARCPACAKQMGISEQPWGKWQVLLFCAGGCDEETILRALAAAPGDPEHLAALSAQDGVALDEFARRERARHARREIETWQSTTTPWPSSDSTTTDDSPRPSAPASSPSGRPRRATRPDGSPPGSTSSGRPPIRSSPASDSASTGTRP